MSDADRCFWCAGTGEIRADFIQRFLGFDDLYECVVCDGTGVHKRGYDWR